VIASSFEKEQFRVSDRAFSHVALFNICAWMTLALLIISTTILKYLQKSGFFYEFNKFRAWKINQVGKCIFIGFYDHIHNSSRDILQEIGEIS
jgi:hypothetical protein